jgi:hypothetical protein
MDFEPISLSDLPVSDKPAGRYDPVPAGKYTANITQASQQETKDGSGLLIKVRYDITGPSHVGRVIFQYINHRNNSAKAEAIGRAQLGDLMIALGINYLKRPEEMVGGQVEIDVGISPASNGYPEGNKIQGVKSSGTPSFAADIPAAPAKVKAAPPWAKK